ncbi:MAG: transposase [Bacillota bacterium]
MPRHARERSETGIYHVILRGINKQTIFKDEVDKERLFETLKRFKMVSLYELYGYCFMNNHIHILIKETTEPISLVVKRIISSYVYWYNWKYERCGHLFQERFKSEAVENDRYFLTVLRYIHQNPVRAGIAKKVYDFRWSSFQEYMKKQVITNIDFALDMFSADRQKAIILFEAFMNEQSNYLCLDYDDKTRVPDSEIKAILLKKGVSDINELPRLEKRKRDEIINALKSIEGVTIRQLSRLTGITKSVIGRIQ